MLARLTQLSRRMLLRARTLLPKKRLGVVGSFLVSAVVVLGVFGVVDVLFAEEEMITWVMNGVISALSWAMFIIARLCIGLTIFFLKFFVEVATYNNYIDTPTVKVGWFLVRDVANMFFVVLLLVISFGTILGVEQYEWKKTLGKLVFAAIFINFSNTIAQLIIDVAQVFTITFVNAISATAGGNIITMFNIDTVYKITGAEELGIGGNIRLETFGASVAVFLMALLMAVTIGAYALVMVARMVVLWVLIIVSPLAYIFQVIPQTQKYAQEWWSQFINHVIVAPVMVFFVWLAFATLSAPQQYLNLNADTFEEANSALEGQTYKLSISEATSWENLANYIIAIAFLLVGLRKVRELGVEAGGLTSSATGFAKKVAGYATGYVVGRAAYEGLKNVAVDTGGDYLKLAKSQTVDRLRNAPGIRNVPILGAASKARRKAAVSRAEELATQQQARYTAEGPGKWSLEGLLAPSKDRVAEATVRAVAAQDASELGKRNLRHVVFANMSRDERMAFYDKKAKMLEKQFGEHVDTEEMGKFHAALAQARTETDSNKKQALIEEASGHLDDVQKKISENQRASNVAEEDMLTKEKVVEINDVAAKNLPTVRGSLLNIAVEENKGDEDVLRAGIEGEFNLSYLMTEVADMMKRKSEVDGELLQQKVEQLKNLLDGKGGKPEQKAEAEKTIRGYKKELLEDARKLQQEKIQKELQDELVQSWEADGAIVPRGWGEFTDVQKKERAGEYVREMIEQQKTPSEDGGWIQKEEADRMAVGKMLGATDGSKWNTMTPGEQEKAIDEHRLEYITEELVRDELATDEEFTALEKPKQDAFVRSRVKAKKEAQKQVNTEYHVWKELQKAEGFVSNKQDAVKKIVQLNGKIEDEKVEAEFTEKNIAPILARRQFAVKGEEMFGSDTQMKTVLKGLTDKQKEALGLGGGDEAELLAKFRKQFTTIAKIPSEVKDLMIQSIEKSLESSGTGGISSLNEQMIKQFAYDNITAQERALEYKKKNILQGLSKLSGEYLTAQSTRKSNKYKSEMERRGLTIGDMVRSEEGKFADLERTWEIRKAREELTEHEDLEFPELADQIKENYKLIRSLKDVKKVDLSEAQSEALKNQTQRQFRAVSSLVARFPQLAASVMGSLNETYKDQELLSPENIGKMTLGFLSGRDWGEISSEEGFAKTQEDVRKVAKEKADPLFRTLMLAFDRAVNDKEMHVFHQQARVGVDANGVQKIGLTGGFSAGVGGSVKHGIGTGMTRKTGAEYQREQMMENYAPSMTINTAKDGRAYVVVGGDGRAVRPLGEEYKRAIVSISSLAKSTLSSMDPNKILEVMGGGFGYSPIQGRGYRGTPEMRRVFEETMKGFADSYRTSITPTQKGNILQSWQEMMRILKVETIKGQSIRKASAQDISSFLEELLPGSRTKFQV